MLIITRRDGEAFYIEPADDLNPNTTVSELFASGPLFVMIMGHRGNQIRIGIDAPESLNVARSELYETSNMSGLLLAQESD